MMLTAYPYSINCASPMTFKQHIFTAVLRRSRLEKTCVLVMLCILLPLSGFSQIRKYSNEFLNIGVGARSLAMSGSSVASIGDVFAGYWNPAGLSQLESEFHIGAMHAEYFTGIAKFDFGAVVVPLQDKDRFVGVSVLRFGVDDIPNTLLLFDPDGNINYDNITSFSVADYGVYLSYAQKLQIEGLSAGGSAKIIHRSAGSFAKAWGFGLDLGAQYRKDRLYLGVMLRDVTTTFNAWSFNFTEEEQQVLLQTGNSIPESSYEITAPRIILGGAYKVPITEKIGFLGELNLDLTTDGKRNVLIPAKPVSIDPHLGIELDYEQFIFLRAGLGNIQKATDDEKLTETFLVQPNLGLGLRIKGVQLDYAITNLGGDATLYSHVFSLMLDVRKKVGPKGR